MNQHSDLSGVNNYDLDDPTPDDPTPDDPTPDDLSDSPRPPSYRGLIIIYSAIIFGLLVIAGRVLKVF